MHPLAAWAPELSREGSGVAIVAKGSTFLVRGALQALALLVLLAAGLAAPQQAYAAAENLNAAPSLEAGSRQLRTPNRQALDRSYGLRCALSRKSSNPLAEARKQNSGADADDDAPADAHAILTAAGLFNGEASQEWQPSPADRAFEPGYPASFQPRAPPPLTHSCLSA